MYKKSEVYAKVENTGDEVCLTFCENQTGFPQIDDHIHGNSDFDQDLDDLELEEVQESTFVCSDDSITDADLTLSLENRGFQFVHPTNKPAKSKKTTVATKKSKKVKESAPVSEEVIAPKIIGKITPMLERKALEIYGKAMVYIPLSDEERKMFVPNWNSASSPAWELEITGYESNRPKDENDG